MNEVSAAEIYSRFHTSQFLPAVEAALADGQIPEYLVEDLNEAIRISKTVGKSSGWGKTMLGEVLFTILCEMLPKRSKK